MKSTRCSIHPTLIEHMMNQGRGPVDLSSTSKAQPYEADARQSSKKSGIKSAAEKIVSRRQDVSTFRDISGVRDSTKGRKTARARSKNSHDEFSKMRMKCASKWRMPHETYQHLCAVLGFGFHTNKILASDMHARKKFGKLLIDGIIAAWRNGRKKDNCRFLFITIIDDSGTTLDRQPEFDQHQFETRVRNYIQRDLKLNAIGVIELQAATNFPQNGQGRYLLFHSHLIAWTYDPDFDGKSAMQTKRFFTELSVKPVVIKPITDTEGDIAHLGYYLSKAPLYGKDRITSPQSPTGYTLKPSLAGMRPELCLRVSEVLSHFTIRDLVFGTGEGTEIRRDIFKKLTTWHRQRDKTALIETGVPTELLWRQLRQGNGSKRFEPPQLIIKRPSRR